MAKNLVQEGKFPYLPTADGAESGDAFVVGGYLPCVLLTDAESASPYRAAVQTYGIFNLSVLANDGGASAVAVGNILYWDDKDTPLSKIATDNHIFGVALETVDAGATATIKVMIVPQVAVPGTIATAQIENSAITADKIASDAVTTVKILNANVIADKLASDAVTTAKILDANVTHGKLAADVLKKAVVTLNADKIKAMNAAPEELVATPGETKALEFVSAILSYEHDGENQYGNGGVITIGVEDGDAVSANAAATTLTEASDALVQLSPLADAGGNALALNKALEITNATGAFDGDGTGELTVIVYYREHDLS